MTKPKPYQQQGDVLIFCVDALPEGVKKLAPVHGRYVLAKGEATGHAHTIEETDALDAYVAEDGTIYLDVKRPVTLRHEEHRKQIIQPGPKRIGRVREVDPFEGEIRSVRD